jgi:hypothetical protein
METYFFIFILVEIFFLISMMCNTLTYVQSKFKKKNKNFIMLRCFINQFEKTIKPAVENNDNVKEIKYHKTKQLKKVADIITFFY